MSIVTIRENKNIILILILLLFSVVQSQADVSTPSVTVVPDTINFYADYDISTSTGNGNTSLDPPYDSVYVLFDSTTILPASISPSLISINSTAVNAVVIRGQELAIPTPVSISNNGGSIAISIDASAKIRNPNDTDDHYLWVSTTGTQDVDPVISNAYNFNVSSVPVSAASVTPNPSIAAEAAAYTIGFDVGGGGYLPANSGSITIAFDTSTTVPNGALSGVTVNSTTANAVANNDTVVITTPVTIDNSGSVQVVFASGTGLVNPPIDSTYVLAVRTSTQPTWAESDSFTISPAGQLSISAITAKPDTVNEAGQLSFALRTGSSGSLTANVDSFFVIFEANTFLPATIATSNVTVSSGGFSDNANAVYVAKSNPADEDTVYVVTPIAITDNADVTINFASSAGYANPSVSGNYQLELATSAERTPVISNPFSVFSTTTTVSQPLITPTLSGTSAATSYTVSFNLGRLGRLKAGSSTITLTFPASFTVSETVADYDASTIQIAGGSSISIPTSNIVANNTSKTVQLTLPTTAVTNNGNNIVLYLADGGTAQPITNSGTAGNYQVGVKTSVETTNVNSATFSIGGSAVTINSVTLSDNTVNNSATYTFNITTTLKLQSTNNDYITIVFPQGTNLPSSISTGNMSISGSAPKSPISVNTSTRTVTAYVTQNNLNPSTFNVIINAAANIKNPAVPSATFYKVTISTSQDTRLQTSSSYAITGDATQVTLDTVIVNPAVINTTDIPYTINFTTSSTGKIVGGAAAGSSTILIEFDTGTILPTEITASNVEVNSTPAQAVSVDAVDEGGTVTVTVPNGMTINNSSSASVAFKTGAALANNEPAGTYNIRVRTSSDTVLSDSTGAAGDYVLSSTSPLSFTSVTPSPSTQNANAGYSVKFKTGSGGALAAGDSIRLVFPSNTMLPTSLSTSDITIAGFNPGIATVQNDTITLTIPTGQSVGSTTDVTVLINQAAGILNPTAVQGYFLKLITSSEPGPNTSPVYNITQTSTTVSAANVSPNPVSPSSYATYTVDFNVGAGGRLMAGTSTMTITFNSSTTIAASTAFTATYITVDGSRQLIGTDSISVNGQAITIITPIDVSIDNNDAVRVELGGTNVLQNPSTTGDYTLQVNTTVETSAINSNSYTITTATAVTGIAVGLSDDRANAAAADTISFQLQNALTASVGTITVTFPNNTLIPASISTAQARVAASATSPPTVFSNVSAVSTNPSTRTVTLTVPNTINANDYVKVLILSNTGVENPSLTGTYNAQVRTSSQNVNGTSAGYSITAAGTSILNLSVDVTPNTPNVDAQYTYSFTTGIRGRLLSGSSLIYLIVPYDADFTQGVPTLSKVTVNGTAAGELSLINGAATDADTLVVTVPASVTIGNSANVTVIIDETAGLVNATSASALTYGAYTSVESGDFYDYSLPVELASFATTSKEGKIVLEWVTESELENAYWMVERKSLTSEELSEVEKGTASINEIGLPFETITYLDGQGSISLETQYSYIDSSVAVGSIYAYRLADVSYDGIITYHEAVIQEVATPLSFQLFDNYPNPFNPSTTIKYSLPIDTQVQLKIFNVLGQEIITLADGMKQAGYHQVQWNGTSRAGNSVASGMYFVYFNAQGSGSSKQFSRVMKILYLK